MTLALTLIPSPTVTLILALALSPTLNPTLTLGPGTWRRVASARAS